MALNLLGNPIQSNLEDDQLKKPVCGLLPKLAFRNKQPINLQKARQVTTNIVVKASSRSGSTKSGHKQVVRKVSHGESLPSSTLRSNASVGGQRSKGRLNSKSHQRSKLENKVTYLMIFCDELPDSFNKAKRCVVLGRS